MRPASMGADGSRITEFPYTVVQTASLDVTTTFRTLPVTLTATSTAVTSPTSSETDMNGPSRRPVEMIAEMKTTKD